MRTIYLCFLASIVLGAIAQAQEPVMIAGGSTPPTPVMAQAAAPVAAVPMVPVMYVPVMPVPVAYAPPVQIVSGGYINPPNVIYFGGPNSYYNGTYAGVYRPSCYSPSVIYFGRGEACQRGYAFTYPR